MRGVICFLVLFLFRTLLYAQAPTINSFAPSSALVGSQIIIKGTNFSTTPGNNVVYFGGVKASVTASAAGKLTVVVPSGSTFDFISITVNGLTGFSQNQFIPIFNNISTLSANSFANGIDFTSGSPEGVAIGD